VLTIGEFSKVTGLTVKTLRFYHEKGLLIPARVESATGYRYYGQGNLDTARVIRVLRELELPLDEIALMLERCDDDPDAAAFLERHREALGTKLTHYRKLTKRVDQTLAQLRDAQEAEAANRADYAVDEKDVEPRLIAGVRMTGRYQDCGRGFGLLGRKVGRVIAGPALCLMYDGEYKEDNADFEPAFPIRKPVRAEGVEVRELPRSRCVTLVHRGPYDTLGRSYARVLAHAQERGYTVDLPTREIYLKGPGMIFKGRPKQYLTEIQLPMTL